MADVVLFSSGATGAKRLAVITDDATLAVRIEVRDAANTLNIVAPLSPTDKTRLVNLWQGGGGTDRSVQIKSTTPQLWVTMDDANNSVWTNLPDANTVNAVSDEITLTPGQTGGVIGWMKFPYVA